VKQGFSVREATPSDYGAVLLGAKVMWDESVYSHMDFDEYKLIARFEEYTESEESKLFLLEQDGVPVGGLFASIGPTFFGHELAVFEETCFVLPEARAQGGFSILLDALERWAVEEGAKAIVFDITSRVKTERTESKLEARGYEYAGATLVRSI
jgi:GNAT superfamily N-acetyltransferase|tara:strand:- start:12378 stop:12839 length:462 start_codon:yes stop_codon:yes gene_type:complete